MECNKDDAIRSKEIAERKFMENDIAGAKKFALKAKALFEPLEGICQMILALDVYLRAETKIGRQDDWYGILEVPTLANEETIKRQYKKLALQTHPNKNNFIGAAGAFKLVSDAWSVLSDKSRRIAYDQMRYMGSIGVHQNSQINASSTSNLTMSSMSGSSTMSGINGLHSKNSAPAAPSKAPPIPCTFWTYCGSCNMGFQYSREYVGRYLKCSVCQKGFLAVEVPIPGAPIYTNGPRTMDDNINIDGSAVHNTGRSTKIAKKSVNDDMNAAWQSTSSSPNGVRMQPAKRKSRSTTGTSGPKRRKVSHSDLNFESSNYAEISFRKVLKQLDVRGILKEKTKLQIRDKLEGFNNKKSNVKNKGKIEEEDNGKDLANKGVDSEEKSWVQSSKYLGSQEQEKIWNWRSPEIRVVYTRRNKVNKKESEVAPVGTSSSKQHQEPSSDEGSSEMPVPDANFYNFGDHSESSFENGQVWAIYDEEDGMPRYYALIQKVVSTHPFEVRLAFLKAKDCNEFRTSNWISCGYSKTCGDFMVGVSEITDRLNGFSHVVAWEKGLGSFIRIFPKKGDIWALYQNWSPDWNEFTPDDIMYKYELVEVLDSYNPSEGISVIPIIKVQGLVSVFKPLLDPTKSRRIPKEEMLRFSHQVPFHVLTGEEAQNSPKGCYELDPGSTPKELLQVVPQSDGPE